MEWDYLNLSLYTEGPRRRRRTGQLYTPSQSKEKTAIATRRKLGTGRRRGEEGVEGNSFLDMHTSTQFHCLTHLAEKEGLSAGSRQLNDALHLFS